MKHDEALAAFSELVEEVAKSGEPHSITVRAVPVNSAERPGEGHMKLAGAPRDLPEGTVPDQPDAIAFELHVAGPPGQPVSQAVLQIAVKRDLRLGTSDALLI